MPSKNRKPSAKPAGNSAKKAPAKKVAAPAAVKLKSPSWAKTLTDKKSGLIVNVSAWPIGSNPQGPAKVKVSCVTNSYVHYEVTSFENSARACQYVTDFGQVQSERFCKTVAELSVRSVNQMTASQPANDTASRYTTN